MKKLVLVLVALFAAVVTLTSCSAQHAAKRDLIDKTWVNQTDDSARLRLVFEKDRSFHGGLGCWYVSGRWELIDEQNIELNEIKAADAQTRCSPDEPEPWIKRADTGVFNSDRTTLHFLDADGTTLGFGEGYDDLSYVEIDDL